MSQDPIKTFTGDPIYWYRRIPEIRVPPLVNLYKGFKNRNLKLDVSLDVQNKN